MDCRVFLLQSQTIVQCRKEDESEKKKKKTGNVFGFSLLLPLRLIARPSVRRSVGRWGLSVGSPMMDGE